MVRQASLGILLTVLCNSAGWAEPRDPVSVMLCGYGLKSSGCDTSYREAASAMRLDETTARITAKGNGRTKADAVYRFVMLKAAETTIEAGYDLFAVVSQVDTTQHISGVSGGGSNGMGGSFPVDTYTVTRPGQAMLIKLIKGAKPQDAPPNVFDAHEVLKFMSAPQ